MSIERHLENVNALQIGTGKNRITALCSKTTKPEKCFDKTKTAITKRAHSFKNYAHVYNVEILNS